MMRKMRKMSGVDMVMMMEKMMMEKMMTRMKKMVMKNMKKI